MGNSLSAIAARLLVIKGTLPVIGQAIFLIVQLLHLFRSGSTGRNPTFDLIQEPDRGAWDDYDWGRRSQDDADRVVKQAQEETSQAKKAQEEAELAAKNAEERAEEAIKAKEEQEQLTREAEEKANEAKAAQDETERKWKEGIEPEVVPTAEELKAAKIRYQYTEGSLHFAIAGVAGSGKSSLINAVRGLHNNSPDAASTGIIETTSMVTRHPDPDPKKPFVWYDLPGAGTLAVPDWEYFNTQGLYIFDSIIVLFDNRFTASDVAILKNCARFKIPSYIVRSKWNQHLKNMMEDMGCSADCEDTRRAELLAEARDKFITDTRKSVHDNLERAQLPQQRVYIVAKDSLCSFIQERIPQERMPEEIIDEVELIRDLLSDARDRRFSGEAS